MSDERIQMSRRRLLASVATVGGASAAAGVGTFASFTDSEASGVNAVEAGTLDLKLDDDDVTVRFLEATDIVPGQNDTGTVGLGNSGSIDGTIEIEVTTLQSAENGYDGDENDGQNPGPGGELEDYLRIEWFIGSQPVLSEQLLSNVSEGQKIQTSVTIPAGESKQFAFDWMLKEGAEQIQGDSVDIDLTFRLVQSGGG